MLFSVHGTIQRTTRMLGVRCAARYRPITTCPPLTAAAFLPASGQCNVQRHRIRISPEPVSRHGLSLARNSAFAPFRGHSSRPAPSMPHRKTSRTRSISNSFTPLRFRGRFGAKSSPDTRFPRRFPALSRSRRSPLPFGPLQPSGSKRSTVPTARSSPRWTPDNPLAPRRVFLSITLRIKASGLAAALSRMGPDARVGLSLTWTDFHFRSCQPGSTFLALRFASQRAGSTARSALRLRTPLPVRPGDWTLQRLKPVAAFPAHSLSASPKLHSPSGLLYPSRSKLHLGSAFIGPPSKLARSPFAPPSRFLLNRPG